MVPFRYRVAVDNNSGVRRVHDNAAEVGLRLPLDGLALPQLEAFLDVRQQVVDDAAVLLWRRELAAAAAFQRLHLLVLNLPPRRPLLLDLTLLVLLLALLHLLAEHVEGVEALL